MQTETAGWYPDQSDRYSLRWWNGRSWTDHVETFDLTAAPGPAAPTLFIGGEAATRVVGVSATDLRRSAFFAIAAFGVGIAGLFVALMGIPALCAAVFATVGLVGSLPAFGRRATIVQLISFSALLLGVAEGIWVGWRMLNGL